MGAGKSFSIGCNNQPNLQHCNGRVLASNTHASIHFCCETKGTPRILSREMNGERQKSHIPHMDDVMLTSLRPFVSPRGFRFQLWPWLRDFQGSNEPSTHAGMGLYQSNMGGFV